MPIMVPLDDQKRARLGVLTALVDLDDRAWVALMGRLARPMLSWEFTPDIRPQIAALFEQADLERIRLEPVTRRPGTARYV